ncbi:alpha/beta fold hydrolase [Exilibacterium tricleocarpae]|uniref:Alpha/beta fold hydrolase n=1 Tax=Exilibacterium tricleocarpae TaxID=2591008 RepID=A0A545TZ10_9GAMM|nr:alpha/beta fold hydrolase [Exilibacterium tricleocarpae]TQV82456.1 alpha/beta fold hydrolase [Exilibacterium tricleocarpae]
MVNRRKFLAAWPALGLTALSKKSFSQSADKQSFYSRRKTYVLVHGSWHGGWCWRYVRKALQFAGQRVYTPTLTGLGDRSHLLNRDIDLTAHTKDIVNLIETEELQDIVLVGHSYAGYVITLVADLLKDRIKRLIYLDAFIPTEGEPFIPVEQHAQLLELYGDDFVYPVPDLDFLGIPENHRHAAWVKRRLVDDPLGTVLQPVYYQNNGAEDLQKVFIRCTQNPIYKAGDPIKDRIEQDPQWRYLLLDSGHDAMITAARALAWILLRYG